MFNVLPCTEISVHGEFNRCQTLGPESEGARPQDSHRIAATDSDWLALLHSRRQAFVFAALFWVN